MQQLLASAAVGVCLFLGLLAHRTVLRPSQPQEWRLGRQGLPFLFDTSSMPRNDTTCSHCTPDNRRLCCGVCHFEGRRCEELYPGEGKVESVVQRYAEGQGGGPYPFAAFSPCELFQRIRGRTLWFMGDSQTWHFFYAAECFLREFAPHYRRRNVTDDPQLLQALSPVEKPHPVHPICLDLVEGTAVCALRVDSGATMLRRVLPALQAAVPSLRQDIMVFNAGLHAKMTKPYEEELELLAKNYAANRTRLPHMVWADTAMQHFNTGDGGYWGAKEPYQCAPLDKAHAGNPRVRNGGQHNLAAARFIERMAEGHLRTWNASLPLWDVHKPGECTHWCQPTAYHVWLFLLNRELRDRGIGRPVSVAEAPRSRRVAGGQS